MNGEGRSTVVTPHGSPGGAYKQWIVGTLSPSGSVTIDEGAATALGNGKSLLPAGVVAVAGEFAQGSCLAILNGDGHELGRGIARYASEEASRIIGLRGAEIVAKLGYSRGDELVHRDDLVLLWASMMTCWLWASRRGRRPRSWDRRRRNSGRRQSAPWRASCAHTPNISSKRMPGTCRRPPPISIGWCSTRAGCRPWRRRSNRSPGSPIRSGKRRRDGPGPTGLKSPAFGRRSA